MRFIWLVHYFDLSTFEDKVHIFSHPLCAYNYCRQFLKQYEKESFYSDYFTTLAHSYSDSRVSFGIEGVIWAERYEIEA